MHGAYETSEFPTTLPAKNHLTGHWPAFVPKACRPDSCPAAVAMPATPCAVPNAAASALSSFSKALVSSERFEPWKLDWLLWHAITPPAASNVRAKRAPWPFQTIIFPQSENTVGAEAETSDWNPGLVRADRSVVTCLSPQDAQRQTSPLRKLPFRRNDDAVVGLRRRAHGARQAVSLLRLAGVGEAKQALKPQGFLRPRS